MSFFLPAFAILGWVVVFFSGAMMVPLAVAWLGQEPAASRHAYGGAVTVTLLSGLALLLIARRSRESCSRVTG